MSRWLLLAVGLALLGPLRAEIRTQEIEYSDDDTDFQGYLAYDDAVEGPRPGVLVVHEWWGHNDYVRRRARMLAQLGYTALAVDMYGDGALAEHPQEAGEFAGRVMQLADAGRSRFLAAKSVLESHPTVAADDLGAIGYCFGGGVVLNMARAGVDLDGVVSFHGSLASPVEAEPGTVEARILVLHGGADSFIPTDEIAAFASEMDRAGAWWEFVSYPGVLHSFTNPEADALAEEHGMAVGYDAEADEHSWQRMHRFLDQAFAD